MSLPVLLHAGVARHGVDQYARTIGRRILARAGLPGAVRREAEPGAPVHLHFTDGLWGPDPTGTIESLAARHRDLSITLHDVPLPAEGDERFARRSEVYRRVVAASTTVICNSAHERAALRAFTEQGARTGVIPLPVRRPLPRPREWRPSGEVAVLGFLYPGKGHEAAIRVAAQLRPAASALGLGGVAPGHDAELRRLESLAAERGVAFSMSGFLDYPTLIRRSREVTVPVLAHRNVSASGSLTDWIHAGRRPIVPDSPYFREFASTRPGAVTLADDAAFDAAIVHAWHHPDTTWLADDVSTGPALDDVADLYRHWLDR